MQLFNSFSKKKEIFTPLNNKTVKMYVCGVTPYDTTHLGHAFTYVQFDVLKRYLEYLRYDVIYTQNVTDIDDDILKKAKETGKNWIELGNFWTERFLSDLKTLNVKMPTHYVKATNSITIIIRIIEVLVKKRRAYEKNGNVYFDVSKFTEYGKLSDFNTHQMLEISKERGGNPNDLNKKNPLDFLLWQSASQQTGEPYWKSPWGYGRPGWHIECSAMITKYLGEQIDIHGGGRDLIFPHHESEIAQSECFSGKKPFVKYFMHTAMLLYKGEKMSKSLGNLVMVSDLVKKHSSNVIRFVLLSHHYRTPWEFDEKELIYAEKCIEIIKNALQIKSKVNQNKEYGNYLGEFERYLNDDLNIPKALNTVVKIGKRIIKEQKNSNIKNLQSILKKQIDVLGLA